MMPKLRTQIFAGVVLSAATCRGLAAQSCTEPPPAKLHEVQEYVAKLNHIDSADRLKLIERAATNAECFWRLRFSAVGTTQNLTIYLSPDFRYITPALFDLEVDPLTEERGRQKLAAAVLSAGKPPSIGGGQDSIAIVEFSDFQCPFCKRQSEILEREVLPAMSGRVRLEYRYFPLAMHPWAREAAEIAACTYSQVPELFWTVHNYYFQHQSTLLSGQIQDHVRELLTSTAALDLQRFDACVRNREAAEVVRSDEALGRVLGVQATPTIFINGAMFKGLRSKEQILAALRNVEAITSERSVRTDGARCNLADPGGKFASPAGADTAETCNPGPPKENANGKP